MHKPASNKPPSAARVQWADTAKGIAILFVVLGHNPMIYEPEMRWIWKIIWLQMPLFFIMAGLFFKPQAFTGFLRSRFHSLVIPFLVACLLFSPFQLVKARSSGDLLEIFSGYGLALGATLGQAHLWFLPALFAGMLLFFPVAKCIHQTRPESRVYVGWLLLLLLFALGCLVSGQIGWSFQRPGQYTVTALPWSGDLAPTVAAYILFGWLMRPLLAKINAAAPSTVLAICCLSMALTFFAVHAFDVFIDMNRRVFSVWWYWLPSLTGTLGWITFAMLLPERMQRVLAYLGERSMVVFIFHYFIGTRLFGYLGSDVRATVIAFFLSIVLSLVADKIIRSIHWVTPAFYPRKLAALGTP